MDKQPEATTKELKKGKFAPPDYLKAPAPKEPGYTYRWIKLDANTPVYGGSDARGWEIVRRGAGSSEPFRSGDLIWARMPADIAADRNAHYAERSNRAVDMIQNPDHYLTDQERMKHGKHFRGSVQITHGRR